MIADSAPAGRSSRELADLAGFALDSLAAMRLPDGVFCFERRAGVSEPLGRSPRYTLMVELGLLRAKAAGYALPFDVDALNEAAWRELDAGRLEPGDVGLLLWIDARRGGERGDELAQRLEAALAAKGGLPARLGMELGWIVTGLAHHAAAGGSETGSRLLTAALDQLLVQQPRAERAVPPLRRAGCRRRRFPNFATQIYSVLALAVVARYGLDDRALGAARTTADRLLELPAPRRRLAVAVRRRARHRRGALRGLLGAPGRDGADGAARAVRGLRRRALSRRDRARAALDPRSQRASGRTWSTARTGWSCARSGAAAARTGSGLPRETAPRSPACRRRTPRPG